MKLPSSPFLRILLVLSLIVILLIFISVSFGGSAFIFLLFPLAIVVGPLMALAFPFSWSFKLVYALGLIVSVWLIVLGFKKREKILGQAFVVAGIILWTFCGLIGLGTGT